MYEFDDSAESFPSLDPPPSLPPFSHSPPKPPLQDIILVYIFCCVLLIVVGSFLQELDVMSGLLVTELILILWPPLLYVWRRQHPVKPAFHLATTDIKNGVLSILSAVALFVLVAGLAQVQEFFLPHSESYQKFWEQTMQQLHTFPLPVTILIMAVLPGVCEELFFRGFMLWGFRATCSDRASILWVGALFGVFHFDPYRLVTVTLLGILFGYLVVLTNSIIPAMLAHITNNAIAVTASYLLMESQGGDVELKALAGNGSFGELIWALLPTMCWAFLAFLVLLSLLRYVNVPRKPVHACVR